MGFEFSNIEQYAGTGAYFTVSTGAATTGASDGSDDGLDLDGVGEGSRFEFVDIFADHLNLGRFGCSATSNRFENIQGHSLNGPADCVFSMRFDFTADVFSSLAAGGGIEFILDFGAGVGAFGDGDEITVALNLDSVPPIASAPLPASALLLLGGIGAAGFASRRRKSKS